MGANPAERFGWVATESLRVASLLAWCAQGVLLLAGIRSGGDAVAFLKSAEAIVVTTIALAFASSAATLVMGALDVGPWILRRRLLVALLVAHCIFAVVAIPPTVYACVSVLVSHAAAVQTVFPVFVLAGCTLLARNWWLKISAMVALLRGGSGPLTAYEPAIVSRTICADGSRITASVAFLFDMLELLVFGFANTFALMQLFDAFAFAALAGAAVGTPNFVGGELWVALVALCVVLYLLACVFEAAPGATSAAPMAARPRVARIFTRRYVFGVLPLLLLVMTALSVAAIVASVPALFRLPSASASAMLGVLVVPAWLLWMLHAGRKLYLFWRADLTRSIFVQRQRAPATSAYGHPAQLVVDSAFDNFADVDADADDLDF